MRNDTLTYVVARADHKRPEGSTVGLLDRFKEKAGEVVQSAKDSVGEATGIDVDQTLDAASSAVEGADSLVQAAESFGETKDKLTGN